MSASDNTPNYDWLIGVFLMLTGSILNNLGNNLMSLGHSEAKANRRIEEELHQEPNTDLHTRRAPMLEIESLDNNIEGLELVEQVQLRQPKKTWLLSGSIIFAIGALITFVSFGFAAQSLLASLESAQFVSRNAI